MAAPEPEVPVLYIIPAEEVGNAFARQYYTILQQSPGLVYRFYQDISKMGRVEDGGTMTSTTTMEAIDRKVQSYGSLRADIKFVDAQESYNGGVIVVVTGSMVDENHSSRDFVQTFFLAPQDKGYYVLNDIFRFLEDDPHNSELQNGDTAPSLPSQVEPPQPPVHDNHISEQYNGEVFNTCENGEIPVEEEQPEEEVQLEEEEPVAEVVDEALPEPLVVVEKNVNIDPPPKKSYASIVMKDAPATVPSPTPPKYLPKVQERRVSAAPVPSSVSVPPSSNAENTDDISSQQSEGGDNCSIYIRNLPYYVTPTMIEEAFKQFGPVKSGGIQIKNGKGFCFGFVAFETADAAQGAIEAFSVDVGGRRSIVEEKRSTTPRGKYKGNGGFRGEGSRGRGSYGGGRGYGRGESNKNDFGGRGSGSSGRGYQNRSEGYQRSDQTGYGSGRTNRGGASNRGAPRVPVQA